jgi:hypothetical protein
MTKFSLPDRIGAACGAAFIILILVGNQMSMGGAGGQNDPHPSGSSDLAMFGGHPGILDKIGFSLEVLGLAAFMFFLGWLVSTLRGRGGAWSWLAGVAGVAGTLALAVKLGSFLPMLAGVADHRDLTPGLARVLFDMNSAGFVLFTFPYAVFMIGAAGALLASGYVGKVLGISGIVIGVAGVFIQLPTQFDPVNGNVLPWILGMLWTLVLGVRLAWKGPRTLVSTTSVEPLAVPA